MFKLGITELQEWNEVSVRDTDMVLKTSARSGSPSPHEKPARKRKRKSKLNARTLLKEEPLSLYLKFHSMIFDWGSVYESNSSSYVALVQNEFV